MFFSRRSAFTLAALASLLFKVTGVNATTLLVTEYGSGNLKAFTVSNGVPVDVPSSYTPIGGSGAGADGMAVDEQGHLFVNRASGTIWQRSADELSFFPFATMPEASSDFYLLDLAATATHLYSARYASKIIYRTDLSNAVVSTISGPPAASRFDGVRIGPDGRLYAVDSSNGDIYAYDINASTWSTFLTNSLTGDASQIEFCEDGRVFLSRTIGGQARIYAYTLNTPGDYATGLNPMSQTLIGAYGSHGAATGIRIGPDGRLYANAFNAGEIWRSNVGITTMEPSAFISGLNEPGSIFFPDAIEQPPTHTTRGTPYEWLQLYFPGQESIFESLDEQDPDGDGFATWQEYISDTNPADSNNFLPAFSVQIEGNLITFETNPTSSARRYHLMMTDDLLLPAWVSLTNTTGTGGALIFEHTSSEAAGFFRIMVTLP